MSIEFRISWTWTSISFLYIEHPLEKTIIPCTPDKELNSKLEATAKRLKSIGDHAQIGRKVRQGIENLENKP